MYGRQSLTRRTRTTKIKKADITFAVHWHNVNVPPLPPVGHIWDVMLVWRKENINKNCLCATVLCILHAVMHIWAVLTGWSTVSGFDLAWFSSLSSKCLCVFGLNGAILILTFFAYILLFTFYWAESGGIGPWPGWLTIVLQCYETVGWVMRHVKSSPKWPIMCRVVR